MSQFYVCGVRVRIIFPILTFLSVHTTTIGAMEALTGLPPTDLVINGEARSAAHHLWSLGFWSDLHPWWGTVVYWYCFRGRTQYLVWELTIWARLLTLNPNMLLCWLEKSRTQDLGLLRMLKGSSESQIVPELWRGPGLWSMGCLWEECLVFQ